MCLVVARRQVGVLGRPQAGGLGLVRAEEAAQFITALKQRRHRIPHILSTGGGRREIGFAPVQFRLQPSPPAALGERRQAGHAVLVSLPRQLPVSSLVTMARDPGELARQVRRPMPRRPVPQAARGTTFHQWLEQRFGQAQLIDADDLPGAADDLAAQAGDPDLADLKARFEAGEWARRWPAEVEVPFETLIGDRLIRGRIDAVFADTADGGHDVIDWKTGRQPGSAAEKRAVAVQLAAYRLAWAALAGVRVTDVRAAFYYVRDNVTVRPADLLDGPGLTALIEGLEAAEPEAVGV